MTYMSCQVISYAWVGGYLGGCIIREGTKLLFYLREISHGKRHMDPDLSGAVFVQQFLTISCR
jgi:hypothetical protein